MLLAMYSPLPHCRTEISINRNSAINDESSRGQLKLHLQRDARNHNNNNNNNNNSGVKSLDIIGGGSKNS